MSERAAWAVALSISFTLTIAKRTTSNYIALTTPLCPRAVLVTSCVFTSCMHADSKLVHVACLLRAGVCERCDARVCVE